MPTVKVDNCSGGYGATALLLDRTILGTKVNGEYLRVRRNTSTFFVTVNLNSRERSMKHTTHYIVTIDHEILTGDDTTVLSALGEYIESSIRVDGILPLC